MNEETKKIFAEIFAVMPHWVTWVSMVGLFVVGLWFFLSYGAPENKHKKKIDNFFVNNAWVFLGIPFVVGSVFFYIYVLEGFKSLGKIIDKLFG